MATKEELKIALDAGDIELASKLDADLQAQSASEQLTMQKQIDAQKTPDQLYEELLTTHRAGRPATDQLLRYADTQRTSGESDNSLYTRIQSKVRGDMTPPKQMSLGATMMQDNMMHPDVADAPAIYAARERGKLANDASFGEHFNLVNGYTGAQFVAGLQNLNSMKDYITAPLHVPINKVLRKYSDLTGKSTDEVLRKYPAYNDVREKFLGKDTLQNTFFPIEDRNEIIDKYNVRDAENQENTRLFEPYMKNSGVGGFFGTVPTYLASQILAGPVVAGVSKALVGEVGSLASGAANATGRGIKAGSEAIVRRHVPVLSNIINKAKSDYGKRTIDAISAFKNRSTLPLSKLTEGAAGNAATNLNLSMGESALRPDEDWKQGVVSGLASNAIAKATRGVLSELPSSLSPRQQGIIDWYKTKGGVPDMGVASGNTQLQREISGVYNDPNLATITQPFKDKQADVESKIIMQAMGVPKKSAGSEMSNFDWDTFWGKKGLGGEMDFRDANSSASYAPKYQDALKDLVTKYSDSPLKSDKVTLSNLNYISDLLDSKASAVGPSGPLQSPMVSSGDMKSIMQELAGIKSAYGKSSNPAQVTTSKNLSEAETILNNMVDDVQVPKGLSYNGKPFDASYIKDLNRRYAIASHLNDNALDLSGNINPKKLVASVYDQPGMLKNALRDLGSDASKDINNLASYYEMKGKAYHSNLEGSPVASESGKSHIDTLYSGTPSRTIPSMYDTWRMNRYLSGKPGMTGLVGAIPGVPNMKNDRGLWTPFTLGRVDASGAHVNKDLIDFGNNEYEAYNYYSQPGNESEKDNYSTYMADKLRKNTRELAYPHVLMDEIGTGLKELSYPLLFGASLLRESMRDKKKDKEGKRR